jgi:hypothetical protein
MILLQETSSPCIIRQHVIKVLQMEESNYFLKLLEQESLLLKLISQLIRATCPFDKLVKEFFLTVISPEICCMGIIK